MAEKVILTDSDAARIEELTTGIGRIPDPDRMTLLRLREKLKRAVVVPWHAVDKGIVTVQSRVIVRDQNSGQTLTYTLVFPEEADYRAGRISVTAPIGAAILGHREGDIIEWEGAVASLRLQIQKVLYQPEASAVRGVGKDNDHVSLA